MNLDPTSDYLRQIKSHTGLVPVEFISRVQAMGPTTVQEAKDDGYYLTTTAPDSATMLRYAGYVSWHLTSIERRQLEERATRRFGVLISLSLSDLFNEGLSLPQLESLSPGEPVQASDHTWHRTTTGFVAPSGLGISPLHLALDHGPVRRPKRPE